MSESESKQSEWKLRQERIAKKLEAAPIVEIAGVVSAKSSGGSGEGDDMWMFGGHPAAWRIKGGKVQEREIEVRRFVSHPELHRLMDAFKSYRVIRIRGRAVDDEDGSRVLLEDFLGAIRDPELEACADRIKQPVTFSASDFGVFTLDRSLDRYDAEVTWDGCPTRFSLSAESPGDVEKSLEQARKIRAEENVWSKKINDCILSELLSLKNKAWLEENERELSAEEFLDRITIESITVDADGRFCFWYDDGDVFWGHCIEVRGNTDDGPEVAMLAG